MHAWKQTAKRRWMNEGTNEIFISQIAHMQLDTIQAGKIEISKAHYGRQNDLLRVVPFNINITIRLVYKKLIKGIYSILTLNTKEYGIVQLQIERWIQTKKITLRQSLIVRHLTWTYEKSPLTVKMKKSSINIAPNGRIPAINVLNKQTNKLTIQQWHGIK